MVEGEKYSIRNLLKVHLHRLVQRFIFCYLIDSIKLHLTLFMKVVYTINGMKNVKTDIAITESEIDVIVFDEPISIKTVTNKNVVGVKLIWTVDAQKALAFINNYSPECDILFVHINWGGKGAMYLLSKEGQKEILKKYGKAFYFKLPKAGINPRGVEITNEAINKLVEHSSTKKIEIDWNRDESVEYNSYARWVDHWKEK